MQINIAQPTYDAINEIRKAGLNGTKFPTFTQVVDKILADAHALQEVKEQLQDSLTSAEEEEDWAETAAAYRNVLQWIEGACPPEEAED
jgi:hypothetical protein